MSSLILHIFKLLKDWQKALMFSFVSYMVVLFFIIVAIVFIFTGFSRNLPLIISISAGYMSVLIFTLIISRYLFKRRLVEQ